MKNAKHKAKKLLPTTIVVLLSLVAFAYAWEKDPVYRIDGEDTTQQQGTESRVADPTQSATPEIKQEIESATEVPAKEEIPPLDVIADDSGAGPTEESKEEADTTPSSTGGQTAQGSQETVTEGDLSKDERPSDTPAEEPPKELPQEPQSPEERAGSGAPESKEETKPPELTAPNKPDVDAVSRCERCKSDRHTTDACLQKSIETGAYGRWMIPEAGIDVAIYTTSGNAQEIVDRKASAAIFRYGSQYVIADHSNQDFAALKTCQVGTKAYLETEKQTREYVCTQIINGHNTAVILTDEAGNDIRDANPGGTTCYTCRNGWKNVFFVFFRPIGEDGKPVFPEEKPTPPEEPLPVDRAEI